MSEELIPLEVLFGEPEKASPQISPDGTRIAYLAPYEGILNIWVRAIGKEDDKPLTQERHRGIRFYFWAKDNNHIIYLQDSDGDENWHLYSIDLTTFVIRDLTPFVGIQASVVGTNYNFPNEMLIGLNLRDRRVHDVYRLNLITGGIEKEIENPGNVLEWLADHGFKVRGAWVMNSDGTSEVRVCKKNESQWQSIVRWELEDNLCMPIGFTPDDKGLYLFDSRNANTMRVVQIDLDTGEQTVLVEDAEYDVNPYYPFSPIEHPLTRKLQAVCIYKERAYWEVIDDEIKEDVEIIKSICKGDFFLINRDNNDKKWLIGFDCDDAPISYYVYDRENKQAEFLFTSYPKLKKYKLAEMKPIKLTARDGLPLHGYLTLPVGIEHKNLPTVLIVHGGPWFRDMWGYNREVQFFSNRGYACLQINFRGSTGYGKQFLNAGNKEWAGKMHDDLIDAVNWVIKEGIADKKRIAIYGHSYGGYAALVGATFTPDVFNCAVAACGGSNLITWMKNIPPYWEPMKGLIYKRVGNPETEEEFLKSRSPLFNADKIKIPILIVQGANDPRVKKNESEQIVNELRSKNIPVEYILFPDEGHSFLNPDNRLKFYMAMERFFATHLGAGKI